jgi:hypothetical protein
MFTNLQYLDLGPYLDLTWYQELSLGGSPPAVFSSILLELHLNVVDFTDCLYLLDGRFNQLHTLYVHISYIDESNPTIKQVNYFD